MCLSGCSSNEPIKANDDEFIIIVNLDVADDVYEIQQSYFIDGVLIGSGGMSHADESKLAKGPYDFRFSAKEFPENTDISGFSCTFALADNLYNDRGAYPVKNEIKIAAKYGSEYYVTISGDKEKGYTALLKAENE